MVSPRWTPRGSRTMFNIQTIPVFSLSFPLYTPTWHNDLPVFVAWSFWHILKLKSSPVKLENVFSALWAMVTRQFSTSMHFYKLPVKKSAMSSDRFSNNAVSNIRGEVTCCCCLYIILFSVTSFNWLWFKSCVFVCSCEAEVFVCCSCVQRGNHRLCWCGVVS